MSDVSCSASLTGASKNIGNTTRRELIDALFHCVGELPALQDGPIWVSRFRNIVDYLRQYSNGEWDLDRQLDETARADSIA